MVPKKAKELYKTTAEVLGVEEALVERVTSFFWSEVRKAMVEGKSNNINICNLGTFSARPDKVQYLIDKYNQTLSYIKPESFRKCQIIQEIKIRIEKLKRIQDAIEKDLVKKEQVKIRRYGKEL